MKHIQIEVIANEHQQEELIALLDEYNPSGFEQTDEKLLAYFNENDFEEQEIKRILEGYPFSLAEVAERNWNAVWEQNFPPVVVGDFCAVRAHFHEPIAGVEQEIVITPKMSFGTGHHATTYMMIEQMRELDFINKSVFDFGTGTGILSILAEKQGAKNVVAIDVDDWSIENARENFERNACQHIEVTRSSKLPEAKFDIILANINRNVILDYMKPLVQICGKDSSVLFSGLLAADEQDIKKAAVENDLRFIKMQERQGWISLLFVNER